MWFLMLQPDVQQTHVEHIAIMKYSVTAVQTLLTAHKHCHVALG